MRLLAAVLASALFGCASRSFAPREISDVVVQDFASREPKSCTTADVDLENAEARAFFERATVLDYRSLAERYPIAPCELLGTLRLRGQLCDWKIRPGAVGEIECAGARWYFACDTCEDLFARTPKH